MITIEHPVDPPDTCPLERISTLRSLLLLGIETTGFSGDTSQPYLIGYTYHDGFGWKLIQWFTNTRKSEAQLLTAFFTFMGRSKVLMRFNEDGFNTPYLLKCYRRLGLDCNLNNIASVDVYKKIKPCHGLLGFKNMKQKSVEQFLSVSREDKYSGGQLIEVHRDYLVTHESFLYDLLILHNEGDLKGMSSILPILNCADVMEAPFALDSQQLYCAGDVPGPFLNPTWKSPYSIPVPLGYDTAPVSLELHRDVLTCNIALYQGELKCFHPNYRDHHYLPFESTAVHKGVGEYVGKDARKKATAHTCYPKRHGLFLPQFGPLWSLCLKGDYKAPSDCVAYSPDLLSDSDSTDSYARQILNYINHKREV